MNPQPDYIPQVRLADYDYSLPEEHIAFQPSAQRDDSRLLLCDARDGAISHHHFSDLPSLIPSNATLVLNDTRVVRARLHLYKESGGKVEALLIDPVAPSADPAVALAARGETLWRCMVGGLKKIRNGSEVCAEFFSADDTVKGMLRAHLEDVADDGVLLRFRWTPEDLSFAEVIERVGHIPLPPYIKRSDLPEDASSYQTVYAEHDGAVAAPTAGLHFTPTVLEELTERGVQTVRVTLHVGAGTFAPLKGEQANEHAMHAERIAVSLSELHALVEAARRRERSEGALVVVGTTSLRTLESLYWYGVRLIRNEIDTSSSELAVNQWDPYRLEREVPILPSLSAALEQIAIRVSTHNLDAISGVTRLMILPGYRFRSCDALVTNFHQPGSTLVLLVAAFLGKELWHRAYDAALREGYRFLSYGDSSLLINPDATAQFAPA